VAGHRPIVGLGWPLGDVQDVRSATATIWLSLAGRASGRALGAQVRGELFAQPAAGLHEQRPVDRFVRHLHLRVVGVLGLEPARDLLR
jgi:hypothetical protein